jgi:cell division protein FtsW (lipid II flippase)
MSEILDEIEVRNTSKRFSKLSLLFSLLTIGLFIFLAASMPKTVKASEGLPLPPTFLIIAFQLFWFLGMIMMLFSFVKKEPSSWQKWIGAVLNSLLSLMLLGAAIIGRVMG